MWDLSFWDAAQDILHVLFKLLCVGGGGGGVMRGLFVCVSYGNVFARTGGGVEYSPIIDMGFLAKRSRPQMPTYLLRQPADHRRTKYSTPKNTTRTISWQRDGDTHTNRRTETWRRRTGGGRWKHSNTWTAASTSAKCELKEILGEVNGCSCWVQLLTQTWWHHWYSLRVIDPPATDPVFLTE